MNQTATRLRSNAAAAPVTAGLPVGSQTTILGLALYGVAMGLAVLATVIGGAGFMTVFFGASLAVSVVLIALILRFGAWPLVLTALLMLLNLAASGRYMVEGLRFPESFLDFTISLLSVTGSVVAIVGAIAALVARRRGATRSAPTRPERVAAGALVAALVGLTLLSGMLTLVNRDTVSAEAKAGALPVRMNATKFEPERIEGRAGQPLRIVVRNSDPGAHSFVVEALGVDVTINPGSERLIELADVSPGEYAFHCGLFGHAGIMKGTLVVAQ